MLLPQMPESTTSEGLMAVISAAILCSLYITSMLNQKQMQYMRVGWLFNGLDLCKCANMIDSHNIDRG